MSSRGEFSRGNAVRKALAPRRPAMGLFILILTPMALAISTAFLVALLASSSGPSAVAVAWYAALPVAAAAVGLLASAFMARLTPPSVFDSRSLMSAVGAAYGPHLAGVVVGVSVVLDLLTLLPEGLQPLRTASSAPQARCSRSLAGRPASGAWRRS